jgi:hypothetical protein
MKSEEKMVAHRIETVVEANGTIVLKELPFQEGEAVEVIVLERKSKSETDNPYPLRGMAYTYIYPTEPVAVDDWDALK